jgi:hypothetical protein
VSYALHICILVQIYARSERKSTTRLRTLSKILQYVHPILIVALSSCRRNLSKLTRSYLYQDIDWRQSHHSKQLSKIYLLVQSCSLTWSEMLPVFYLLPLLLCPALLPFSVNSVCACESDKLGAAFHSSCSRSLIQYDSMTFQRFTTFTKFPQSLLFFTSSILLTFDMLNAVKLPLISR